MGIYYKWVCEERGEHLLPVGNESDKHPAHTVTTLRVLALLCQWGSWNGKAVRLISDAGSDDFFYGEHLRQPGAEYGSCDFWKSPPDLAHWVAEAEKPL